MILTSVKYLLFVVLINADGTEQMNTVSFQEHNDKLSCLVEKAGHKDIEGAMLFFCGDKVLYQSRDDPYFNKQQKLY